jgi:hypothetical protein
MPVRCRRIAGFTPEDSSRIQRLNRAITNPKLITAMLVRTQSEKRPFVGENLGFDPIRVEPPFFVLNIHR